MHSRNATGSIVHENTKLLADDKVILVTYEYDSYGKLYKFVVDYANGYVFEPTPWEIRRRTIADLINGVDNYTYYITTTLMAPAVAASWPYVWVNSRSGSINYLRRLNLQTMTYDTVASYSHAAGGGMYARISDRYTIYDVLFTGMYLLDLQLNTTTQFVANFDLNSEDRYTILSDGSCLIGKRVYSPDLPTYEIYHITVENGNANLKLIDTVRNLILMGVSLNGLLFSPLNSGGEIIVLEYTISSPSESLETDEIITLG